MSKQCLVCGNKIGMWSSPTQIIDGYICKDCINNVSKALGFNDPLTIMQNLKISKMTTASILEKLDSIDDSSQTDETQKSETTNENQKQDYISDETPDDEFDSDRAVDVGGLSADFTSKIVMTSLSGLFTSNQQLYYFKDITGYKPNIEGHEVKKHHGIARAATGGILFGGAGAIVGAMTGGKHYDVISKISITVFLSNGDTFGATMLSDEKKADSWTVKGAQQQLDQWCNLLDRIINDNQTQPLQQSDGSSHSTSNADEIRKYKDLFDDGIITKEEFDKKKAELLNL